jgi:hypothetical protein
MFLRIITNIFLLILIPLLIVDTFPFGDDGLIHFQTVSQLQRKISPLLDATGLWQGVWAIFAPEPLRTNVRLSANLRYADGQEGIWNSPNWTEMTWWEWKRNYRMIQYLRYVQSEVMREREVFKPLVHYLSETQTQPDAEGNLQYPMHITLNRHRRAVLPPFPPNETEKLTWRLLGAPVQKRFAEEQTYVMCWWNR